MGGVVLRMVVLCCAGSGMQLRKYKTSDGQEHLGSALLPPGAEVCG